jgi:hypothetical protein
MKKFVSSLLVLVTTFTSILLNESLLSYHQVTSSLLCKCNHTSKNEIHSNSVLLDEHKHFIPVSPELPSCHTPKKGETHLCSCKKSADSLANILFQKSVVLLNNLELFAVYFHNSYISCSTKEKLLLPVGFSFLITPPPKTIL